jgi:hypothetical protein
MREAWEALVAARPASGLRPETEAEWDVLIKAYEKLGYASLIAGRAPEQTARELARAIFSGPAARLMLEIALTEDSHGPA